MALLLEWRLGLGPAGRVVSNERLYEKRILQGW